MIESPTCATHSVTTLGGNFFRIVTNPLKLIPNLYLPPVLAVHSDNVGFRCCFMFSWRIHHTAHVTKFFSVRNRIIGVKSFHLNFPLFQVRKSLFPIRLKPILTGLLSRINDPNRISSTLCHTTTAQRQEWLETNLLLDTPHDHTARVDEEAPPCRPHFFGCHHRSRRHSVRSYIHEFFPFAHGCHVFL